MKVLYQRDVGRGAPMAMLDYLCAEEGLEADDAAFARELLGGVLRNLPELDRVIAAKAREWRLDRLANVDRNILRLGVYELTQGGDVPASVAINEAVELAKVYGGAESGRFVNGVLGQVARELGAAAPEPPPPGADELEGVAQPSAQLGAGEELALQGAEPQGPDGMASAPPAAAEETAPDAPQAPRGPSAADDSTPTGVRPRAGAAGPRAAARGKVRAAEAPAPPPGPGQAAYRGGSAGGSGASSGAGRSERRPRASQRGGPAAGAGGRQGARGAGTAGQGARDGGDATRAWRQEGAAASGRGRAGRAGRRAGAPPPPGPAEGEHPSGAKRGS